MVINDKLAYEAIISIKKTWDSAQALEYVLRGANVNYIEPLERRTLLHEAASFGFVELADKILEQPGVDLAIRDGSGRTAAELAEANAHFDLAEKLRNFCPR